jgi:hypothetical protein
MSKFTGLRSFLRRAGGMMGSTRTGMFPKCHCQRLGKIVELQTK